MSPFVFLPSPFVVHVQCPGIGLRLSRGMISLLSLCRGSASSPRSEFVVRERQVRRLLFGMGEGKHEMKNRSCVFRVCCLRRYRLVGLVVKASASSAEDPGFDSCLRRGALTLERQASGRVVIREPKVPGIDLLASVEERCPIFRTVGELYHETIKAVKQQLPWTVFSLGGQASNYR